MSLHHMHSCMAVPRTTRQQTREALEREKRVLSHHNEQFCHVLTYCILIFFFSLFVVEGVCGDDTEECENGDDEFLDTYHACNMEGLSDEEEQPRIHPAEEPEPEREWQPEEDFVEGFVAADEIGLPNGAGLPDTFDFHPLESISNINAIKKRIQEHCVRFAERQQSPFFPHTTQENKVIRDWAFRNGIRDCALDELLRILHDDDFQIPHLAHTANEFVREESKNIPNKVR